MASSSVTWEGKLLSSQREKGEASYPPLFVLRGHSSAINSVFLYVPPPELAHSQDEDFSDSAPDGVFSFPLAVSCDGDGFVWVWDLSLRKPCFSFQPVPTARHINQRAAVHRAAEALAAGDDPSPTNLPSLFAADDDLRPLHSQGMGGVLWARVMTVRTAVKSSDDPNVDGAVLMLPVILTQCRNQKVYVWSVESCDDSGTEAGYEGAKALSSMTERVSPQFRVRLLHSVHVKQMGFCSALAWLDIVPRGIADAEEDDAADDAKPQSIVIASPDDNNGCFTLDRFHFVVNASENSVTTVVESSASLLVADFKCGQAMSAANATAASLPSSCDGEGVMGSHHHDMLLLVGYESGHVVVYDTRRFACVAVERVFPDPVTSLQLLRAGETKQSADSKVRTSPQGGGQCISIVAGSADGNLQALRLTMRRGGVGRGVGEGRTVLWSYRAAHGIGSLALNDAVAVVGGWDGQTRVLDVSTGAVITNLVFHSGSVATVALAGQSAGGTSSPSPVGLSLISNMPGGKRRNARHVCVFATAGADRNVALWVIEWA